MLFSFHFDYFRVFEQTGGRSHNAFRTAEAEPKLWAFEHVEASRTPDVRCTILTGEWWTYWPLRYCALDESDINLVYWEESFPGELLKTHVHSGEVWCIEFEGSGQHFQVRDFLQEAGSSYSEAFLRDPAGQPIISLIGPLKPGSMHFGQQDGGDTAISKSVLDSAKYRENIFCENLTGRKADLVFSREVWFGARHPGDGVNQSGFWRKFLSSRIHGENDSSLASQAASAKGL